MIDHPIPAIVQTISGRLVNLLDPQPEDILLRDIAYHLSRIPRFNGATIGRFPWWITDHSLLVEHFMSLISGDPCWRLAALLHDAHEYVIGDITRPVQSALWTIQGPRATTDAIQFIKKIVQDRIHDRFALPHSDTWPADITKAIHLCDNQALNYERKMLLVATPEENWAYLPDVPENRPLLLAREPVVSARKFAGRVLFLWLGMNGYVGEKATEIAMEPAPDRESVTNML